MQNFGIIFRLSTLASLRSRWFWGYTIIIFGFIALIFSSGVTDSRVMGFTGLTRLLVIFIQACNLVLPVFILVSTVRTLVKERETNVFEYLLRSRSPQHLQGRLFGPVLWDRRHPSG